MSDAGRGHQTGVRDRREGEAFRGRRVHQVRLQGGDASSDSYCFPS